MAGAGDMATFADRPVESSKMARGALADQGFFLRFAILLALLIVASFAQFAWRGLSNPITAPPLVHLHGLSMLAWLGIFVAQNVLVHRGQLALHRMLGWIAVVLLPLIVATSVLVTLEALRIGRVPPIFSPAFLSALTLGNAIGFVLLVGWAIVRRRQIQWHRRLMLGSIIILSEPAFGRLLPLPLMNGWGQWGTMVTQLLLVVILARHDRKTLGRVHHATVAVAGTVVAVHVLLETLAVLPPFIDLVAAIAAG